jgi:hypothetical protein
MSYAQHGSRIDCGLQAFWNNAFDVNRTFVISDETDGGTPIGIDFFEMRRRVPSDLNENVRFQYGPYGKFF